MIAGIRHFDWIQSHTLAVNSVQTTLAEGYTVKYKHKHKYIYIYIRNICKFDIELLCSHRKVQLPGPTVMTGSKDYATSSKIIKQNTNVGRAM